MSEIAGSLLPTPREVTGSILPTTGEVICSIPPTQGEGTGSLLPTWINTWIGNSYALTLEKSQTLFFFHRAIKVAFPPKIRKRRPAVID